MLENNTSNKNIKDVLPTPAALRLALNTLGWAMRMLGIPFVSVVAQMDATSTHADIEVEYSPGVLSNQRVNLGGVDENLFDHGPRA